MRYTTKNIGELAKQTRKAMGLTQKDLALTCNTGLRFIIEFEKGKPTCQFSKVLTVLYTLGIRPELIKPEIDFKGVARRKAANKLIRNIMKGNRNDDNGKKT